MRREEKTAATGSALSLNQETNQQQVQQHKKGATASTGAASNEQVVVSGWDILFEELLEYRKDHGKVLEKERWAGEKEDWLALWVVYQKHYVVLIFEEEQKPIPLDVDRIAKLDGIGLFGDGFHAYWDALGSQAAWDIMLPALKKYYQCKNGPCRIECGASGEYSLLAHWAEHESNYFARLKSSQSKLSARDSQRLQVLETAGFFVAQPPETCVAATSPDSPQAQPQPAGQMDPDESSQGRKEKQEEELLEIPAYAKQKSNSLCNTGFAGLGLKPRLESAAPGALPSQAPVFPQAPSNWLTLRKPGFPAMCSSFATNLYCKSGFHCLSGHVYHENSHKIYNPRFFDETLVEILRLPDSTGRMWYSSGYIFRSSAYNVFGNGGRKENGIYWYETEAQAREAIAEIVIGFFRERRTNLEDIYGPSSSSMGQNRESTSLGEASVDGFPSEPSNPGSYPKSALDSPLGSDRGRKRSIETAMVDSSVSKKPSHFPEISSNWVTHLKKCLMSICPHFENGRKCDFGNVCKNAHVHRDARFFPFRTDVEFAKCSIKLVNRPDTTNPGTSWFTAGCADNCNVYYVSGGEGFECEKTGIWWYKSLSRAKNALRHNFENPKNRVGSTNPAPESRPAVIPRVEKRSIVNPNYDKSTFEPFMRLNHNVNSVLIQGVPFPRNYCAHWHVRGVCSTLCQRIEDHTPLSPDDTATLVAWCNANWK